MVKDTDIVKILLLAEGNKYETACAGFDVVDHINKIDLPGNMRSVLKNRKLAVQAMTLLSDHHVKFGYEKYSPVVTKEALDEEE